jgi:gliding motility-associated-like protein
MADYRIVAYKNGDLSVRSASNKVMSIHYFDLHIPNTFTPNGDELNDTFSAITASGWGLSSYSMLIFNKYGQLLYETYDIDSPWDGTYKGKIVKSDSYVYKIFATGTKEGVVNKTGTVTVLL